jgi:hypothetical protein
MFVNDSICHMRMRIHVCEFNGPQPYAEWQGNHVHSDVDKTDCEFLVEACAQLPDANQMSHGMQLSKEFRLRFGHRPG